MSWITALRKNSSWLNVRVQSLRTVASISRTRANCAPSRSDHVYASRRRLTLTAVISRMCFWRAAAYCRRCSASDWHHWATGRPGVRSPSASFQAMLRVPVSVRSNCG